MYKNLIKIFFGQSSFFFLSTRHLVDCMSTPNSHTYMDVAMHIFGMSHTKQLTAWANNSFESPPYWIAPWTCYWLIQFRFLPKLPTCVLCGKKLLISQSYKLSVKLQLNYQFWNKCISHIEDDSSPRWGLASKTRQY